MESPTSVTQSRLRAPLGFQACKIDGAGRLKLPAKYLQYLNELPDKYLFLTEYEGKARIFTNGSWERTIAKIADKDLRRRFTFIAESKGGDIDCDPQGRVTLPGGLRKELKLEDTTVQMRFWEDVITIFTQEQYAVELASAVEKKSADRVLLQYMDLGLE
jgi:DNA-binding transcriptional regulator/RsmH inhibitor MraZ